ncbi:ABC transporter, partial [Klebsiella pneumoniae]|nr:ABC transporter [Klebsiella pneumoniae]
REKLAEVFNLSPEVFSFNNQLGWCTGCKGRGTTKNVECKKCKGKRYSEEIEQHEINLLDKPHSISNINDLSIESILSLAKELNISEEKQH